VRPQRAGARRQQELLGSLEPGDEIVSAGGLYGVIRGIDGEELEVEIADGLVVRMARGAVAGIVEPDDPGERPDVEAAEPR
jgi:preprotein translocase subunit YajC